MSTSKHAPLGLNLGPSFQHLLLGIESMKLAQQKKGTKATLSNQSKPNDENKPQYQNHAYVKNCSFNNKIFNNHGNIPQPFPNASIWGLKQTETQPQANPCVKLAYKVLLSMCEEGVTGTSNSYSVTKVSAPSFTNPYSDESTVSNCENDNDSEVDVPSDECTFDEDDTESISYSLHWINHYSDDEEGDGNDKEQTVDGETLELEPIDDWTYWRYEYATDCNYKGMLHACPTCRCRFYEKWMVVQHQILYDHW